MTVPTPAQLRAAMALVPTGVTVVSALGREGPAGATANAVTSLSLEPPLMLACFDRGSRTLGFATEAGRFGISVLRADHADQATMFASKSPHEEKWRDVPWSERSGVPILDRALAWTACELERTHDGGDHVIAIGRIVELGVDDGEPLVFHRGLYRGLD
jgi:3-hydroxy-9,10-secoandrosta-1,3,5(10)-triene-9,17-dione monooxygenase reductase component